MHVTVTEPSNALVNGKHLAKRSFRCQCGRPVFFRNSQCLGCGSALGYEPDLGEMFALEATEQPGVWRLKSEVPDNSYQRCANLETAGSCNWLVRFERDSGQGTMLCKSCALDRTIPDLSVRENADCYQRISIAKRRLISLLISLKLPAVPRAEDPKQGLAFDFLRSPENGQRVLTGHDDGIITLNIEEAEDPTRELIREQMGEPYRTLLGHLRHETGHYYWDRLIAGGKWLDGFRELFGNDQQDYDSALQRHYSEGALSGWQDQFVSAYASSHPWEDWAETWAHYLHMMDTFETAQSFGLDPGVSIDVSVEPFEAAELFPGESDAPAFAEFINSWVRLTAVLNELSRAMGLADFYPFVLSKKVVAKLYFIHSVINDGSAAQASAS